MTYYPANERYDKKNRIRVSVSLNKKTEPELTEWVASKKQPSTYLKDLAREDMKKRKNDNE